MARFRLKLKPDRVVALMFIVVFAVIAVWRDWPDGQFHLWMLDVGQGQAILIQTPAGQQILVDGGPSDRVLPELARHMPFWDRRIERVILSHNHADHLTGLIEVARRFEIGEVWWSGAVHTTPEYAAWIAVLEGEQIPQRLVMRGESDELADVQWQVIFPLESMAGEQPTNQHDANVVLRVDYKQFSALLAGDLEADYEAALVEAVCSTPPVKPTGGGGCSTLASDILAVPHHGSKTGLEPEFLAAVSPAIALISVGANNPYGHPHSSVLDRLKTAGIPVYRTNQHGTIELRADGSVQVERPDA